MGVFKKILPIAVGAYGKDAPCKANLAEHRSSLWNNRHKQGTNGLNDNANAIKEIIHTWSISIKHMIVSISSFVSSNLKRVLLEILAKVWIFTSLAGTTVTLSTILPTAKKKG